MTDNDMTTPETHAVSDPTYFPPVDPASVSDDEKCRRHDLIAALMADLGPRPHNREKRNAHYLIYHLVHGQAVDPETEAGVLHGRYVDA